jgi:threonine/homoserine/homoserine lactone efflux protein
MIRLMLVVKAIFSGLFTGLVVSIPLGPAGLESVKRTISKGYKEGFLLSLGAISGDALDIFLINFGLLNILSGNRKAEAIFWMISGIVLTAIGYLSLRGNERIKELETHPHFLDNKRLRSYPFFTGFLLVFLNPLTHSLWITMSGTVIRVWRSVGEAPYYTFMVSIIVGMIIWFAGLNYFALKGNKKISTESSEKISSTLMIVMLLIGIGFFMLGVYFFFRSMHWRR